METLKFSTKLLRTPHYQNHFMVSQNSRNLGVYNNKSCTSSLTLTCKLKTSKWKKISKRKIVPGRISLLDIDAAPPVLERKKVVEERLLDTSNGVDGEVLFKKVVSNLSLAIGEMFAVAGLMALGTIIDQVKVPELYFQNFPEDHPPLGFSSCFTLSLDQMFSSPIFLGTLALLGASLMAYTCTTQDPLVKVPRRRSFINSAEAIHKQEHADALPRASVKDLGVSPMGAGHEVFPKGPTLNAFKGLAGRVARIGVHLALLLVMSGGNLSAAGSLSRDVTVPQGLRFVVGDALAPSGVQSTPSDAFSIKVQDNRFNMDYDESGEGGEGPLNLTMTPPKVNGEKKLIVTFQRVGDGDSPNVKGISMPARDLQSIIIHDKEGRFACVRRPNSNLSIEIDGTKTIYVDTIGSSGLGLKTDPGAQIVYAGFGFLMLTTGINILSHAQGEFPDIVYRLLDKVSESAKSSFTEESDSPMDSKS